MSAQTIFDQLERHARERPHRPAVADPRDKSYRAWDTTTWAELKDRVVRMARALCAVGHEPQDAVGIWGPNSAAWAISSLASTAAGGVAVGVYATLTADQVAYILGHARASVAIVDGMDKATMLLGEAEHLETLKAIILFPGTVKEPGAPSLIRSWTEAEALAESVDPAVVEERRRQQRAEDPATLIYTSGTTGPPKAVQLSHENLSWTARLVEQLVDAQRGDRVVSYLPLAHIAEQMLSIHLPITFGATTHFVPDLADLRSALVSVRPTVFFGVPRVYEKMQSAVEAQLALAPGTKRRMFREAQRIGLSVGRDRFEGRPVDLGRRTAFRMADKLIYQKVKARLGLDRVRMAATGAAPMSKATHDWFLSIGLPLSEVYGQSEDSGPTTFNKAGEGKLGTAGKPVPGVEVKLAEDGEILVRGPNVFLGYFRDESATNETLVDGWLHSGDIGVFDKDGYLKITDRKKDIIITAGGKNVSPQNIERRLLDHPRIEQAVVVGDGRKYLTALVSVVLDETEETNPVAVEREVSEWVEAVNRELARYEQIKKFSILDRELSEAEGELTPSLKVKRRVVNQRYKDLIDAMY